MINEIQKDQKDRDKIVKNIPMVGTTVEYTPIKRLTEEENREMKGVLNPPESIDKSTRQAFLKIQLDHIKNTLGTTIEERDNTNNPEEYIELEERIIGLWEARDLTEEQIEKEEVREQQEEDISRLQRFKKWAKENMVGLSAIAISVAGIITTIIIGARNAIVCGAQATGKFAKALYNLSKKLGSLAAPLLNILAQAISLGAKGLTWLASSLWVLVIALTLYIYERYKQRRKK